MAAREAAVVIESVTQDHESRAESDENPATETAEVIPEPPRTVVPVIIPDEIGHFRELGLGRAIDSTDHSLWQNKPSMQIRAIAQDLSNVIGTDEKGILQQYETIVSSLESQQAQIKLALHVPGSKVQIGLDAHYAQSTTSSVRLSGNRVRTRTVSFRYDFDDLPTEFDTLREDETRLFEKNVADWILGYLRRQQQNGAFPTTPDIGSLQGTNSIEKLADLGTKIDRLASPQARAISRACQILVFDNGITHYVSTIELGAVSYTAETVSDSVTRQTFGSRARIASSAALNSSVAISQEVTQITRQVQRIGSFDPVTGAVTRNTREEAVIGFQIEPVSRLIRVPLLELAMRRAIERYIQHDIDNIVGPFLISTEIHNTPVYWTIYKGKILGTDDLKQASLFYFDEDQDNKILIAYWGESPDDRVILTDVIHSHSRVQVQAPKLPRYVTTHCNGPLRLKSTFALNTAEFKLYNRVQNSFACLSLISTPASLQNWLDGDEYFIKHQSSVFRSKYVTMHLQENSQRLIDQPKYTTTFQTLRKDPENGMLFRLHPAELRLNSTSTVERAGGQDMHKETPSNPASISIEIERHLLGDCAAMMNLNDNTP